ncbi:hypothetical protein KAFR_0G01740 [Kazachstania africana CBS 2517]|uniref:Ribosome biogenesis protein ALB1 n=1 Tax=Kazachstania africana (strain ATCC 22294 / BCRC 22015 / CBS 2517 / CECT 1963 / NBRC 1671 / NRRL Y-8276) TaxID=1071382 RepID=H2AXV8_KAZAF|nr:hypothetical protein KAFR_0G01740 [Kazachstania africana CBS 2517]CCF59208.1 hypothetical protein KAFR_0G01740 [Kazachstania africana CBS 2517]
MPSKNSINRPKLTLNANKRVQRNAKKRDAREKLGLLNPQRSSESSKSGEIKSVALDLYFNKESSPNGPITTKTLSKKRTKKIERNLKYAEQRKLLLDVGSKIENDIEMDVDSSNGKKQDLKKSNLTLVKEALWSVIEDTTSDPLIIENGQGTTFGGPFFP